MRYLILAFAFFIAMPSFAWAGSQRGTSIIPPGNYSLQQFAVQGFDPSLGTLERVTLRLTQKTSYDFYLENVGSASSCTVIWGGGSTSLTALLEVSGPQLPGESAAPHLFHTQIDVGEFSQTVGGPYDGTLDFSGASGGMVSYDPSPINLGVVYETANPSDLARWINSGWLIFQAMPQVSSGIFGGCGATNSIGFGETGGRLIVTYRYH